MLRFKLVIENNFSSYETINFSFYCCQWMIMDFQLNLITGVASVKNSMKSA